MNRLHLAVSVIMHLGIVLLLSLCGCLNQANPCHPDVPAGRIKGWVSSGGLTLDTRVEIKRVNDDDSDSHVSRYDVRPSLGGYYYQDLPAGRYIVSLRASGASYDYYHADAGLTHSRADCDTVTIIGSRPTLEINFVLGDFVLQADLANELNDTRCEITLHRRVDDKHYDFIQGFSHRKYVNIANGHFITGFAGILPGEFRIELELKHETGSGWNYDSEHIYAPGTYDPAESTWFNVSADSITRVECNLPPELARIEGRVTGACLEMGVIDSYRLPLVIAISPDSSVIRRQCVNFPDGGSFSFGYSLAGSAKLLVVQDGIRQWIGGETFAEATTYNFEQGQVISDIDLVQSGLAVSVNRSGHAIRYLELRFYDPDDLSPLFTYDSYSFGYSSLFGIPNLQPGSYLLNVTSHFWADNDWRPQWFDRATAPDEVQLITISTPGEIVPVAITLEPGGEISLNLEFDQEVSDSYRVVITSENGSGYWNIRENCQSGQRITFSGLPDGEFKICALQGDSGWDPATPIPDTAVWYPGTSDVDSATIFEIIDAWVIDDVVFEMP
ncbi:MAG: hypothetical protein GY835_26885 [bacterium]|nr:hypothetical protein [bacterium]